MSDTEVRELFETMLVDPAPDTTDIEAAILAGERRRRTRVTAGALSAAAAVVLVLVVAATIPNYSSAPVTPSSTTSPQPALPTGSVVTQESQLLGTWLTVQLGDRLVTRDRDRSGNLLSLTFSHVESTELVAGPDRNWWWSASDGCNVASGEYTVDTSGTYHAASGYSTLIGCSPPRQLDERENVRAPAAADQANIIAGNGAQPSRLLLSRNGLVIAVYERMPDVSQTPSPTPSGEAPLPPARSVAVGDQIPVPGLKLVITVNDDGFCLDPAPGLSAAQSSDLPPHNCWSASDPNFSLGVANMAVGSSFSWGSHSLHTGLTVTPVDAVAAVSGDTYESGVVLAPPGKDWKIYYAITPWTPVTIDGDTTGDQEQWDILLYDVSGRLVRQ